MIVIDNTTATCEKELGTWTIRVNGCFVASFWRARKALSVFSKLVEALQNEQEVGHVDENNVLRFSATTTPKAGE
jgi:hypothetical protein